MPARRERVLSVPRRPAVRTRAGANLYVRFRRAYRNMDHMKSQTSPVLGRALRALRNRAELTQAEVAANAGFDGPYLSRAESGERDLRWSTVLRLLDAIGADLHQLADALVEVEQQDPSKR